ncbi:MAG: PilZ domain-containing protein [Gammaproteobacteria bacterium]|nr:MAG: PilZ domain-containing protein [Gammaproteobacteria bacterium]
MAAREVRMVSGKSRDERRRMRRYPVVKVVTELLLRKGLFGSDWLPVRAVDLSAEGMAIDSEAELQPGQLATLRMVVEMDMGHFEIDKLVGHVLHSTRQGSTWRCGLQFDYAGQKHMQDEVFRSRLQRIIDLLERTHALADRIQKQQR